LLPLKLRLKASCAHQSLYNEAEKRLIEAIKSKDFSEVCVVQGLMEVAKKKMTSARETLEQRHQQMQEIKAKQRKVLDRYCDARK